MTVRIYERTSTREVNFSSILNDSTGGGPFSVIDATAEKNVHSGILRSVSISCDSTDFSISIRSKSNGQPDTIDEIYTATTINRRKVEGNLYVPWVNGDATLASNLYIVVVNSDVGNSTGAIRVMLSNSINKRFSGGK